MRPSTSMPVATPRSSSRATSSSVARLPAAPAANGEPPRPADRGVEPGDAELQRGVGAHEGGASGLVEVQPDVGADRVDHLGDPAGRGHAGGVGAGDRGAAAVAQPLRQRRHVRRADVALVGRAEAAAEHGVDGHVAGDRADAGDRVGGLVDRHAHVALAVGLRQRGGDRELVDVALERQLGARARSAPAPSSARPPTGAPRPAPRRRRPWRARPSATRTPPPRCG